MHVYHRIATRVSDSCSLCSLLLIWRHRVPIVRRGHPSWWNGVLIGKEEVRGTRTKPRTSFLITSSIVPKSNLVKIVEPMARHTKISASSLIASSSQPIKNNGSNLFSRQQYWACSKPVVLDFFATSPRDCLQTCSGPHWLSFDIFVLISKSFYRRALVFTKEHFASLVSKTSLW